MKKRLLTMAGAVVASGALALSGCSNNNNGGDTPTDGPIVLTVSGWSLDTTPEFQILADAFTAANPDIKVEVVEYDAADYQTLIQVDMSAGKAPDIITIKEAKVTYSWATGGQLLDISDVVRALPTNVSGAGSYAVNGVNYGAPYRQDSWVLFYNKDLFDAAGVAHPNGQWTWDDYAKAAREVTAALKAAGSQAVGAYEHSWQSTLQGFAQAQTPGADLFSGKYDYLKPYYERVLALQNDGAQATFGTVTTNKLTYQGQFGKQSAAMMAMGSWYVATLVTQQKGGEADDFQWGIAPVPQYNSSTFAKPVTFGDPTGMGINAKIDSAKLDAAKKFLTFVASESAAVALAEIGIVSSVTGAAVTDAFFAQAGLPTDELSREAMSNHETKPENPQGENIAAIQTILGATHTAVMSESQSVDDAIAEAQERVANEVGI
ncbi:MAG: extracellular solute-binding protein [Propionibacteriaceae bacterium]|jgi:multiple sugar transport system substrate-binding protein|nr:extracellular solute-binding protein [Propionibacteriaceae bacterium]